MNKKGQGVREIEIDFNKYLGVIRRRWWIILCTVFISVDAALVSAFLQVDEYRSEARLLFESGRQTSSLIGLEDAPQELRALTTRDDPLDTQVEVLRSIPIAEEVIQSLGLIHPSGLPIPPNALLANLEVESVPGTDVLKIAYTSEAPEEAVEIVDALMNAFINQNISSNRSAAVTAQNFIRNQLPATDAQVGEAEEALKNFKELHNIVDFELETAGIVNSLQTIDDELTQIRSQYANLSSQSTNIKQRIKLDPDQAYEAGVVSQSSAVDEVLKRLNEAESELASERSQYDQNHPVILDLEDKVGLLRSLLAQRVNQARVDGNLSVLPTSGASRSLKQGLIEESLRIDNELVGLSQQIEKLTAIKLDYKKKAEVLPSLEKRYRDLERKYDAARGTHEQLLNKLEEARVLQNQSIGNARVISPAQLPTKSTALPKGVFLLGGGALGLLLGFLLAFLIDYADDVQSTAEIQKLYGYPVLGSIDRDTHIVENQATPNFDSRSFSIFPTYALDAVTELMHTLTKRNQGNLPQLIGITSTDQHKEHSEITASLAIALSRLGKSVLIVDANLPHSVQHHYFNISNQQGLTNVLTNGRPLAQVVQQLNPHLSILPAGPRVKQTRALLRSTFASDYIQSLKHDYDYILVDAPPVNSRLSFTDISFITHAVLVCSIDNLWKSSIKKARKRLDKKHTQHIVGILIRPSHEPSALTPISNNHLQKNEVLFPQSKRDIII